jgi:hypothetical protein
MAPARGETESACDARENAWHPQTCAARAAGALVNNTLMALRREA